MKKVVITGAAGFIGVNLVRYLLEKTSWSITGLDALKDSANSRSLLGLDPTRFNLVIHDLCTSDGLKDIVSGHDVVIHLAAETHNDNSLRDPSPFIHSNVMGTYNLLEVVRDLGIRLHHVSTDEVFGDLPLQGNSKFTELSPYNPSSPYSATKAASDHLVRAWVRSFGINATISNCSNNYGPYQNVEKFIPRQITNILTGEKPKLYGQGLNVRDWIHVDDHADALMLIIEKGVRGETYLIGTNNELSNKYVLEIILDTAGLGRSQFEEVPDRAGHDLRYAIDNSKLCSELKWQAPSRDFKVEISKLFNWYDINKDWWAPKKEIIEQNYASEGS